MELCETGFLVGNCFLVVSSFHMINPPQFLSFSLGVKSQGGVEILIDDPSTCSVISTMVN